jgi:hypothetical protein
MTMTSSCHPGSLMALASSRMAGVTLLPWTLLHRAPRLQAVQQEVAYRAATALTRKPAAQTGPDIGALAAERLHRPSKPYRPPDSVTQAAATAHARVAAGRRRTQDHNQDAALVHQQTQQQQSRGSASEAQARAAAVLAAAAAAAAAEKERARMSPPKQRPQVRVVGGLYGLCAVMLNVPCVLFAKGGMRRRCSRV